jgi:putative colanic acid biosynthesis acetyltransferase WcaF
MNASDPTRRIFHQLELVNPSPYSRSEYIRRAAWELVQLLLIRPSPKRAYSWRRFWLRVFGAEIPASSKTRPSTVVRHPWLLKMGEYSTVADRVDVYNLGLVTIGDHSVISQGVEVCAGTHDYTKPNLPLVRSEIVIGSGVWICASAFISPGVTIGHNSIVAARAVVTRDVPDGVIVGGNPAKVLRDRPMPDRYS